MNRPNSTAPNSSRLIGASLLMVVAQLAVIYVPALHPIFKSSPLPLPDLLTCFGLGSVVPWWWRSRNGWRPPAASMETASVSLARKGGGGADIME